LETRGRRRHGLSKIFRAAIYRAHRAVVFVVDSTAFLYELHLTPRVFYSPHFGGVSVAPDRSCWVSDSRDPKLFGRAIIFDVFQRSNLCENHTDGQTTCNLITALCVASRGNKRYVSAYTVPYILETTLTALHFAGHSISLSSLKFLWQAPEFLFISAIGAFRPSKIIQDH